MLKEVNLGKVVVVTTKNEVGVLSGIAKILADHGINIEAASGNVIEGKGVVTLMTEDNLRAKDALGKQGYESVEENDVVVVDMEHKAGALKVVSHKLADAGIDIKFAYCTVCAGGCPARMVISTDNNEKALMTLKK